MEAKDDAKPAPTPEPSSKSQKLPPAGAGYSEPTAAMRPGYAQRYRMPRLEQCLTSGSGKDALAKTLPACLLGTMGSLFRVASAAPLTLSARLPWDALRYDGKLSRCAKFQMTPGKAVGYPTVVFESKVASLRVDGVEYHAIPFADASYVMLVSFSKQHSFKKEALQKVERQLGRAKSTFVSIPYARFQIERDKALSKQIDPHSEPWIFHLDMFGLSLGTPPARSFGKVLSPDEETQRSKGVLIDRPFSFGLWNLKTQSLVATGAFTGERDAICGQI